MAKSSRSDSISQLVQKEVEITEVASTAETAEGLYFDSESNSVYNEEVTEAVKVVEVGKSPKTMRLRSRRDARLLYTGQVTGKRYVWDSAGSVVEVDFLDGEILLAKKSNGKTCCGSSKGDNSVFEIAN